MKPLNLIMLTLVIIGGVNWGLVGFFNFDLVASVFGEGPLLAHAVCALVGLSALGQLVPLAGAFKTDEAAALRGSSAH